METPQQRQIRFALGRIEYCVIKLDDAISNIKFRAWKSTQPKRTNRQFGGGFGGEYCADTNFTGN